MNTIEIALLKQKIGSISGGQNVLLKVGNTYSLMKYEGYEMETESHSSYRQSRHCIINTTIGDFYFADTKEKRQKLAERRQYEWKRHKCNIYGTRLDFIFDEEFEIYLPCSADRDLFLTLARETYYGEIIPCDDKIEIIVDNKHIVTKLHSITRLRYFENVVLPLLAGKCTTFNVPKRNRQLFRRVNLFTLLKRFKKATQNLDQGAFVYVGCKEEVYLLGLTRGNNGKPYMSTKPIFYFSNNYLHGISKYDAEKPKSDRNGACNVAIYRTYDIPSFNGHPFIFPQIGRKQNHKNTIFTGEPQIITGNVDKALAHFATTDFVEFADVVEKYAEQIDSIHSSSEELNGQFYY